MGWFCHLCHGKLLEKEFGRATEHLVTSDCKPRRFKASLGICLDCLTVQKIISEDWLLETKKIYSDYSIYSGTEVGDHIVFQGSDRGSTRSSLLTNWMTSFLDLNGLKNGNLLDVGCGNGSFLKAFGERHPSWGLTGFDVSEVFKESIEKIDGVENFVCDSDLRNVKFPKKFDLIVLIHSLEHVVNPRALLSHVSRLLEPDGYLLIQVPDLDSSPFDLIVLDHCTHFTRDSMSRVFESAALSEVVTTNRVVKKEITGIYRVNNTPVSVEAQLLNNEERQSLEVNKIDSYIAWLNLIIRQAEASGKELAVFGCGISGTWIANFISAKLRYFVDEDPCATGKFHSGVLVKNVDEADKYLKTLLPFTPQVSRSIHTRLSHRLLNLVLPPSL